MTDKTIKPGFSGLMTCKRGKIIAGAVWVCLCLALLIYTLKSGRIGYETIDDAYMAMIPSGFFGKFYSHTIYNNRIIGFVLSVASRLSPSHNWNTLFYLGLDFAAFMLLGCVLIRVKDFLTGILSGAAVVALTFTSLTGRMNFSKTGALVLGVGIITLIAEAAAGKERASKLYLTLGAVFTTVGSLIRFKTTLALLPFLIVAFFFLYFKNGKKKFFGLFTVFLVLIVIALAWLGDYISYEVNPSWREYKKFDSLSGELWDYGVLDYDSNKDVYEDLGLSKNDMALFAAYEFADDTVYTNEKLETLLELHKQSLKEMPLSTRISKAFKSYFGLYKSYPVLYLIIALMVINLIFGPDRLLTLAFFTLPQLELLFLTFEGRIPERAVFVPMIMAVLVSLLEGVRETKKGRGTLIKAVLTVAIALILIVTSETVTKPKPDVYVTPERENSLALFDELSSRPGLYVWEIGINASAILDSHSPLDAFKPGSHHNSVLIGSWLVRSPIMADISRPYGSEHNPFELLCWNRDTYFVTISGADYSTVEAYLNEHYDEEGRFVLTESLYGYDVYKFK